MSTAIDDYKATNFKVRVHNLPKFNAKKAKAESLFAGIPFSSLKISGKSRNEVLLGFDDVSSLAVGMEVLKTMVNQKGEPVKFCRHIPRDVRNVEYEKPPLKTVIQVTCPHVQEPYEAQLKKKQLEMIGTLQSMHSTYRKMETKCPVPRELPEWFEPVEEPSAKRVKTDDEQLTGRLKRTLCPIDMIIPSPQLLGYRNKCQFTVGRSETGEITAGFRLSGAQHGCVIGSCKDHPITPKPMLLMVEVFEKFLRDSSLPVHDQTTHLGVWRDITLRYFEATQEFMAIVQVKADEADADLLKSEVARMLESFKGADISPAKLTSVHLLEYNGVSFPDADNPTTLLFGSQSIHDILNGVKFAVSPNSFFQVNSRGAEVLFNCALSWAIEAVAPGVVDSSTVTSAMTLLDMCCGTGTIGLCMAKQVRHLVGVDSCKTSIEDARNNSILNGIENATFVADFAENVVVDMFETATERENPDVEAARKQLRMGGGTIAIVDPPRAGLHRRVLRTLRLSKDIKYLVYISCNPTGSFKNDCLSLCRLPHKQRPGYAFKPVKCVPVDMFPHTDHCELVMLFEKVFPPEKQEEAQGETEAK